MPSRELVFRLRLWGDPVCGAGWLAMSCKLWVIGLFWVVISSVATGAGAQGVPHPHLDEGRLPQGCMSCHQGHGTSGSPMLGRSQVEVCLGCHGATVARASQIANGSLAVSTAPTSLESALLQPFLHPLSDQAFSREDAGEVVCSSCHSPHRLFADADSSRLLDVTSASCLECHEGLLRGERALLSGLTKGTQAGSPMSFRARSLHPVETVASERSPSLLPGWSGQSISCQDCHGNADSGGAQGVHGSPVRFLLRSPYETSDGAGESNDRSALCYSCHERERVLDSPLFPSHRVHVVDRGASCSTCHDPHGSIEHRALIRFATFSAEASHGASLAPSLHNGRLSFDSLTPGSGSCSLSCHGVDHAAVAYGVGAGGQEGLAAASGGGLLPIGASPDRGDLTGMRARKAPRPRERE